MRRATQALGHAPKIMLSSWSPPAPLKADHREDCNNNLDCTLARENGQFVYDQFAAYWIDSLRHYATLGIVPDYITLENELSFIPPSWEGCKFDPRIAVSTAASRPRGSSTIRWSKRASSPFSTGI